MHSQFSEQVQEPNTLDLLSFFCHLQQLETSIKKELVERARLVRIVKMGEEKKAPAMINEVRRSGALASGARVLEFKIVTPAWAGQVSSFKPLYQHLKRIIRHFRYFDLSVLTQRFPT
jgi:hypothetical protein